MVENTQKYLSDSYHGLNSIRSKFVLPVKLNTINLINLLQMSKSLNSCLEICYYVHLFQHTPECSSSQSPLSPQQTTNEEEAEQALRTSQKKPSTGPSRSTKLQRAGSVKDLISKFSGPDHVSSTSYLQGLSFGAGRVLRSASVEALESLKSQSSPSTPSSVGQDDVSVPSITVTPPFRESSQNRTESTQKGTKTSQITARIDCPVEGSAEKTDSVPKNKTQTTDSNRDSVDDSGMGSVSKSLCEDGTTAWYCGFFNDLHAWVKLRIQSAWRHERMKSQRVFKACPL